MNFFKYMMLVYGIPIGWVVLGTQIDMHLEYMIYPAVAWCVAFGLYYGVFRDKKESEL